MTARASKSDSSAKSKSSPNDVAKQDDLCPVVAVGASAGGLEAYKDFFNGLPAGSGMAFVLVQHLDPSHHSMLPEIIAKATKIPVEEVRSGVKIKPNRVYVIPHNALMALTGNAFTLTPRGKEPSQHLTINFFMRSLAENRGSRAIGIVLSGTGADGTLGLESIKAEGGLTFAQSPDSARYDGMPRSAIDSGCVDFVLPPKGMAKELLRIHNHPYAALEPAPAKTEPASHRGDFARILDHLRGASGVDFSQYKPNTIHRRAQRRMIILKLDTLGEYAKYLKEHPEEGHTLYDDVLISVTSFFRDVEVFEALKRQVYPAILKDKSNKGTIRMWAPGCSTGEETYSLAMTLLEFLGDRASSFQVQIFGTDLNEKNIQKARTGLYRESIAEEISPERLKRFFVKAEGGYRVNKAIRDMCVFARQNLVNDPPFSQMNLVACRNLLIYIQPELQKKVIPILHYALKPSGFLILGGSESVSAFPNLFSTVDKKHKIYAKRAIASRLHYDFAQNYYSSAGVPDISGKPLKSQGSPKEEWDLQAEADQEVLRNYAPAGVVINGSMEAVQFRGRTTPYLEQAPGKPSLNVLKLARNGLALELRLLIGTAAKKGARARKAGVAFDSDGRKRVLNLSVSPLGEKGSGKSRFFLILFEDVTPQEILSTESVSRYRRKTSAETTLESKRSKQELARAREALRSAIESEEALKEEFQSANEEILSANEELQSTNEELETSKEELQSTNEELTTLNAELRHKNSELHELGNDISNLLNSTRIPVVMLDRNLRIRRFTPAADKLLKAVSSDIGRPLADLRLNIEVPDVDRMIAKVLESLQPAEHEVRDFEGRRHSLRILPYRTQDNKIDGVVLALQDIEIIKAASEQLRKSSEFFQGVMNTVLEPLLVLDAQLRIFTTNNSFLRVFKVSTEETVNKFIYAVGNGQWNIPQLRTLLEEILPKRGIVLNYEVEHDFERIGRRTMILNANAIVSTVDAKPMILLAIDDVSERRKAETKVLARLAAIVECSDDAIIGEDLDGIVETWNRGAERLLGYSPEEVIGKSITMLIPPERLDEERALSEQIHQGKHIESAYRRKDGRLIDVSLTVSRLLDVHGEVVGASIIARDITGRKLTEGALVKSEKLATAGRVAGILAHEINNPLQAVTNLMALLEKSPGLDPQERSYAEAAVKELDRVTHLTRQSLSFYRESSSPAPVNIEEVLEEILSLYGKRINANGMTITKQYLSSEIINSYPGEIRQVLSTVLVNAMEATEYNGRISVRVRKSSRWNGLGVPGIRIVIADAGAGIPANSRFHIFEPFFTTKGEHGTGLGLWVAQGIVSRLGGSIRMRSSVVQGKSGTCFSIFLPKQIPNRV